MSRERQQRIRFWEAKLTGSGYLLDPATEVLIKETIKDLKELDEIKEKEEK